MRKLWHGWPGLAAVTVSGEAVKGVDTLIALTFLLTLEDPNCFRKSVTRVVI